MSLWQNIKKLLYWIKINIRCCYFKRDDRHLQSKLHGVVSWMQLEQGFSSFFAIFDDFTKLVCVSKACTLPMTLVLICKKSSKMEMIWRERWRNPLFNLCSINPFLGLILDTRIIPEFRVFTRVITKAQGGSKLR